MTRRTYDCGSILIDVSEDNSNGTALAADPHYQNAVALIITSENSSHTGTITVAVSVDGGSNYRTLQSGGSDVVVAADKAVIIEPLGFTHLRLESSGNEGADRTFTIRAVEEI